MRLAFFNGTYALAKPAAAVALVDLPVRRCCGDGPSIDSAAPQFSATGGLPLPLLLARHDLVRIGLNATTIDLNGVDGKPPLGKTFYRPLSPLSGFRHGGIARVRSPHS